MTSTDPTRRAGVPVRASAARSVELAAQWIEDGRRLDMQGLADELGISRVTLFRHSGGREELLAKALWVLTERMLTSATRRWEGERPAGALRTPGAGRYFNALVSQSPGLRRLLNDEPTLTMRLLTDPRGRVQTSVVAYVEAMLRLDMAESGLVPLIEPSALAYALVRLGESFLYADVLASRQPDVETANRLQRALIEGTPPNVVGPPVDVGTESESADDVGRTPLSSGKARRAVRPRP